MLFPTENLSFQDRMKLWRMAELAFPGTPYETLIAQLQSGALGIDAIPGVKTGMALKAVVDQLIDQVLDFGKNCGVSRGGLDDPAGKSVLSEGGFAGPQEQGAGEVGVAPGEAAAQINENVAETTEKKLLDAEAVHYLIIEMFGQVRFFCHANNLATAIPAAQGGAQ